MKNIVLVLLAAVLLFAPLAGAQESSGDAAATQPGAKLRADLVRAVQNGHLTDEQKSSMKDAGTTLRDAVTARQNGQQVDRAAVKKAFSEIKKVTDSDAFRPEDKQAVKADLEAMKEKAKDAGGGRRRGLFRGFLGGGN